MFREGKSETTFPFQPDNADLPRLDEYLIDILEIYVDRNVSFATAKIGKSDHVLLKFLQGLLMRIEVSVSDDLVFVYA